MTTPKTIIIYWSATGNTALVAEAIQAALADGGIDAEMVRLKEAKDLELLEHDLVFLGCPSYNFLPPKPVLDYLEARRKLHKGRGDIVVSSPPRPGKNAVVFVTYSGPHTGIREAIPVGKYAGQLFEHIGFTVRGEWYTVGEFHNREEYNLHGRMGDIHGRPNAEDLAEIRAKVAALIEELSGEKNGSDI